MRRALPLLLLAAGCASEGDVPAAREVSVSTPSAGSPSAARDTSELDPWNGQDVSLQGTFESDRAIHGIVKLSSGLRVWIVNFDLFARGDDWLAYVGRPCVASGILHTYTRDIDGYRQPRLEIKEFSGTRE